MKNSLGWIAPPPLFIAPKLLVIVGAVAAYTALVALGEEFFRPPVPSGFDSAFTVVNALILGTLLTFRTNEAC